MIDFDFFQTERLRKNIALLIATTLVFVAIFVTVFAQQVRRIEDASQLIQDKYAEQERAVFEKNRSKITDSVHHLSENMSDRTSHGNINIALDDINYIMPILKTLEWSVIVWTEGGPETFFYTDEKTKGVIKGADFDNSTASWQEFYVGDDKYYAVGGWVYPGAGEKILMQFVFHHSKFDQLMLIPPPVSIEPLAKEFKIMGFYLSAFLFGILVFGTITMFLSRYFVLETIKDYINQDFVGNIAVQKGLLSEDKLRECLEDQKTIRKER